MYDTLYAIVNKSENATLQFFIFSEKVLAATLIFISGVVWLFHLLRKGNQVLFMIW